MVSRGLPIIESDRAVFLHFSGMYQAVEICNGILPPRQAAPPPQQQQQQQPLVVAAPPVEPAPLSYAQHRCGH